MTDHLVHLARDWDGTVPKGGTGGEIKHNGWRCSFFTGRDGKTRLWTRNGMPLEGADHVLHRLRLMEQEAGQPMFFDGEIVVYDGTGNTLAATKHWFETGWKGGGEAGTFHAFDCLTFAEWKSGGTPTALIERKARLRHLIDATADQWDWRAGSHGRDEGATAVQMVEDAWLLDVADVMTLAHHVWADGGEGLMLKDMQAPYQRSRTDAWLKVTRENQHKWMKEAA